MKPKLVLLLVLALGSAAFLTCLLNAGYNQKICCEKKCPQKTPPSGPQSGGGGDEMPYGSFNHLIVSTIR